MVILSSSTAACLLSVDIIVSTTIGASAPQSNMKQRRGLLEEQRYAIYRDLTSWVASVGGVIRDNNGVNEYGVLFSVTLKAFPKFGFDLNFDPSFRRPMNDSRERC